MIKQSAIDPTHYATDTKKAMMQRIEAMIRRRSNPDGTLKHN